MAVQKQGRHYDLAYHHRYLHHGSAAAASDSIRIYVIPVGLI